LFIFLIYCLLITGVGILTASLIPVQKLVGQLPSGQIRRSWHTLRILTIVFIVGYLGYLGFLWNHDKDWPDLIVTGIFFFGACFVWLTSTLALQTALDIRRVTLLEKENITDPLTGLYNRRHLDRRLEEEFGRAKRYAQPLSILLVDIDHFKRINDNYGHQTGDFVLSYLGKLVLNAIRTSDIGARYGGEELLIICPNTARSSAAELAERLRRHIELHELVLAGEPNRRKTIHITVSIGVAIFSATVENVRQLVQEADLALYRAKQQGRNRVVSNDFEPAE
jgi:diguanylate cyclase (GGDEF)-like protein